MFPNFHASVLHNSLVKNCIQKILKFVLFEKKFIYLQ